MITGIYKNFNKKMISYFFDIARFIANNLSRKYRYLILLFSDLIILIISSNSIIDLSDFYSLSNFKNLFFIFISTILIYGYTGQYKSLTRYFGSKFLYYLILRNIALVFVLFIYLISNGYQIIYENLFLDFFIKITIIPTITRVLIRDILLYLNITSYQKKKNVLIYGAGLAGAQLAASLRLNKNYRIISFIDDNKKLIGRELYGISIINPENINSFSEKIDKILIAIPSLSKNKFRKIVNKLQIYDIPLMQIPSIDSITKGDLEIDMLMPIKIEDLLYRDVIKLDSKLIGQNIKNKIICITGAGGSIGSELCVQIKKFRPKKIILIEQNEYSLYKIINQLNLIINNEIKLKAVLSNITNLKQITDLFKFEEVDIVFHSAAYKHVPLVEENPLAGVLNNVISTKIICEASYKANVNNVLLVSTDKAVRPTNIMGVSKRISELIIKAYAEKTKHKNKNDLIKKTKFSMVRFGNVLNSSGSVVPLFRKQISKGGPITITDKEVIRYFMTIEEATYLLIQAILLAEGGDLFLLDMGQPVKIYDMALKMIKLSGLKLKDEQNPDGDIEIIYTGLRSGEKLYEELLIDNQSTNTSHPLIYKAEESFILPDELFPLIKELEHVISQNELDKTYNLLKKLVPEWERPDNYL